MTNNLERQFEGIWIPKEIYLNKSLTPTEKLLLAEIRSFAKNGTCFASNEHFADFLGISKKHVSRLITKLVGLKFIKTELIYKKDTKEIDKRVITPIRIEADTPMDIQEDTPPLSCVDPLCVDAEDKIQYKNTINNTSNIKDIVHSPKKRKKNSSSAELESEFELLWAKYPRKIGKSKALQSFIKARKSGKYTYELIESGLNKYIDYLETNGTDEQFIQHGSTWFNQMNFLSEYESTQFQKKPQLSKFNQMMVNQMDDPDDFLNMIGVENVEQKRNRKVLNASEVQLS